MMYNFGMKGVSNDEGSFDWVLKTFHSLPGSYFSLRNKLDGSLVLEHDPQHLKTPHTR